MLITFQKNAQPVQQGQALVLVKILNVMPVQMAQKVPVVTVSINWNNNLLKKILCH